MFLVVSNRNTAMFPVVSSGNVAMFLVVSSRNIAVFLNVEVILRHAHLSGLQKAAIPRM